MDETSAEPDGEQFRCTRKEMFIIIKGHLEYGLSTILELLEEKLSEQSGCSIRIPPTRRAYFSKLLYKMRSVWRKSKETEEIFFNKYEKFLNVPVEFDVVATPKKKPTNKGGRPPRESPPSSETPGRSKRRKTEEIPPTFTSNAVASPAQTRPRYAGELNAPKDVNDVTLTSPLKASESTAESTLSGEAALSVLIECKLSESQYQVLSSVTQEYDCRLYPPHKKVIQATNRCYPPRTAITITEIRAEVQIQALLDHTVERILHLQNDVIRSLRRETVEKMYLVCKWGCNGNSEESEYNRTSIGDDKSDANMFFSSVVPLKLVSVLQKSEADIVVWENPRPSSPRFCRPLRLQLLREDKDSTLNEVRYFEKQLKSLVPFETVMDGKAMSIAYNVAFTVVDGKVCNAVSSMKSSQRCRLCGTPSKDFNDIDVILRKNINETNMKFGLSISHIWIRFFECCLDLSYKLGIRKWQAQSAEEKKNTEHRKMNIQKGLDAQLGLTEPGYGSSNDRNIARRFFENASVSATITGLKEFLIKRFHVILQVVSSGHEINCAEFQEYAVETARVFVGIYPWYHMPISVHKLLLHGPQIIAHALLPIGELPKDAQEALNTDINSDREHFSRKCSRVETMATLFDRLMVTSDPCISSIRNLPRKNRKSLSREAVELLLYPTEIADTGTTPGLMIDTDSDDDYDSDSDK